MSDIVTTKSRYALRGGSDVICLADIASIDDITLRPLVRAPSPNIGAFVTCYLDEIGGVEGAAGETCPGGFTLRVIANPERRSRLSSRLAWLRQAGDRTDQREAARIVPIHRGTTLKLPSGQEIDTIIADLSRTGAALSTPERPEVGSSVTVGKRFATVVRHTQDGIGIAFRLPFGTLTFNEGVVL